MKETRSIELEAEDWARVDARAQQEYDDESWVDRLFSAAYKVRPPEPRTVEFEGAIWDPDEKGRWWTDQRMTTTDREDALFERIYELEHPDD